MSATIFHIIPDIILLWSVSDNVVDLETKKILHMFAGIMSILINVIFVIFGQGGIERGLILYTMLQLAFIVYGSGQLRSDKPGAIEEYENYVLGWITLSISISPIMNLIEDYELFSGAERIV